MNPWPRIFRRRRMAADLSEEMRQHLEEKIEALIAAGMSREEAVHAARRAFGNPTLIEQRSREIWMWPFLASLWADIRFALRQLRKSPGFAITAILVLTLGIGANMAIFAFVDAALIKQLPYPDPSRLVGLFSSIPLGPKYNISYLDFLDWKRQSNVFQSLEAYETWNFMLNTPAGTQLTPGVHVTDGFLRTLGVAPAFGRDFTQGEAESAAPHTVLLSYAAWRNRFGGRRNVLGETIGLDGTPSTIIGVLPKDFHFAPAGAADFWTLLDPAGPCERRRICHNLFAIARLKPGVSVRAANTQLETIATRLEKQYPDTNRNQGAVVMRLTDVIVGDIRPILLLLLGGANLLLLIACVNVSNLLLVRTERRQQEIALRGALGASRARLVRQFTTEGFLLVGIGSALGVACSSAVMHALTRLIPKNMTAQMPYLNGLGINLHLLGFAAAISLAAATLLTVAPMLRFLPRQISAASIVGTRTSAGSVWRHLGANLTVVELAVAVVLLAGAGLLGKSLYRLLHVQVGFRPDHLAVVSLGAPDSSYSKDAQAIALEREILHQVGSLPGVESVGASDYLPLSGFGPFIDFVIDGRPNHGDHDEATFRQVSTSYFTALRANLLQGRYFAGSDDASSRPVIIANRAFIRKYLAGEDPIGKQISFSGPPPQPPAMTIVGVVGNIKEGPLDQRDSPAVYFPFHQHPGDFFSIVARTSQEAESLLPSLAAAIHRIDPGIAVYGQTTMNNQIRDSQTAYLHRSAAWLAAVFGTMALLLSVVGLYGVLAYSVGQRTREIGIRIALGASRGSVYRLILGETGWLASIGIVVGTLGAIGAATLMHSLLFGVHAWDVTTLAAVASLLAVTALLAGFIPARRAANVDPMQALRAE